MQFRPFEEFLPTVQVAGARVGAVASASGQPGGVGLGGDVRGPGRSPTRCSACRCPSAAELLVGVKHSKKDPVDISLTGDGELKGISAAGTGTRKDPKYVALRVVIDKMNDLFGAESFTQSQVEEWVNGLVQRLLADPDLVHLTKVNTKKQFMDLDDFKTVVIDAVADNQDAHNIMADYFYSEGSGLNAVILALADAFYEAARDHMR